MRKVFSAAQSMASAAGPVPGSAIQGLAFTGQEIYDMIQKEKNSGERLIRFGNLCLDTEETLLKRLRDNCDHVDEDTRKALDEAQMIFSSVAIFIQKYFKLSRLKRTFKADEFEKKISQFEEQLQNGINKINHLNGFQAAVNSSVNVRTLQSIADRFEKMQVNNPSGHQKRFNGVEYFEGRHIFLRTSLPDVTQCHGTKVRDYIATFLPYGYDVRVRKISGPFDLVRNVVANDTCVRELGRDVSVLQWIGLIDGKAPYHDGSVEVFQIFHLPPYPREPFKEWVFRTFTGYDLGIYEAFNIVISTWVKVLTAWGIFAEERGIRPHHVYDLDQRDQFYWLDDIEVNLNREDIEINLNREDSCRPSTVVYIGMFRSNQNESKQESRDSNQVIWEVMFEGSKGFKNWIGAWMNHKLPKYRSLLHEFPPDAERYLQESLTCPDTLCRKIICLPEIVTADIPYSDDLPYRMGDLVGSTREGHPKIIYNIDQLLATGGIQSTGLCVDAANGTGDYHHLEVTANEMPSLPLSAGKNYWKLTWIKTNAINIPTLRGFIIRGLEFINKTTSVDIKRIVLINKQVKATKFSYQIMRHVPTNNHLSLQLSAEGECTVSSASRLDSDQTLSANAGEFGHKVIDDTEIKWEHEILSTCSSGIQLSDFLADPMK